MINTLRLVYFSPTGTTRQIVQAITKGLSVDNIFETDLTVPENREGIIPIFKEDLILIGMPVYEEHLPPIVIGLLQKLKGCNQPAVLVSVYGNIGFGMSLVELKELAIQIKTMPIAAAAFIGEHSFSSNTIKLAHGRPDYLDIEKAIEFGRSIASMLQSKKNIETNMLFNDCNPGISSRISELYEQNIEVPGSIPFIAKILREGSAKVFTKTPVINFDCNKCMACFKLCPSGAIADDLSINEEKCIRCFACVKNCKKNGRQIIYKKKIIVKNFLKKNNRVRKEPQLFY